jgi:restriction system protein
MFVPVLSVLSAGGVLASRGIIAAVAGDLALLPDQRASWIPSRQRRFDNRVTWALSYLFQARAVTKHGRGRFEITDRGRKLVSQNAAGFKVGVLEESAEFRDFKSRSKSAEPSEPVAIPMTADAMVEDQTPLEQIDAALSALHGHGESVAAVDNCRG